MIKLLRYLKPYRIGCDYSFWSSLSASPFRPLSAYTLWPILSITELSKATPTISGEWGVYVTGGDWRHNLLHHRCILFVTDCNRLWQNSTRASFSPCRKLFATKSLIKSEQLHLSPALLTIPTQIQHNSDYYAPYDD